MKPETRLRKQLVIPETRHHCYVRSVPFRLALLALAGRERIARGRFIGMTDRTVWNALNGGVVSETLIANSLATFTLNAEKLARVGLEPTFDQFFQVATPSDAGSGETGVA